MQSMLEADIHDHLSYDLYNRASNTNALKGKRGKPIRSKVGSSGICRKIH